MTRRGKIGFDTETYLIAPGRLVPPIVCLTVYGDIVLDEGPDCVKTERGYLVTRDQIAPVWHDMLACGQTLIAHNAAYDLAVLAQATDTIDAVFAALDNNQIADTGIRDMLLAIDGGTFQYDPKISVVPRWSLSECVRRWLGIDISGNKSSTDADGNVIGNVDSWRLRYASLEGVPACEYPEAARDYAIEDAYYAHEVYDAQGETERGGGADSVLVNAYGEVTDEYPQVRAAFALHLCSVTGLRVDPEAVETFEAHVVADVARMKELAKAAGFMRANDTKDMKVMKAMVEKAYTDSGREVPLTKSGKGTSCSRDTLKLSGDAALMEFAELGPAAKLLTTYLPQIKGLRCITQGYRVLVRSGRISAFNPNTTNPPRQGGFRECFVPRDGHVFCSVDLDSAELKGLGQILLWWFGTSALADALNNGIDPHLLLGCRLFASRTGRTITYDEAKDLGKHPEHPDFDEMHGEQGCRQLAKIANFGFPGGLSAKSLVPYARGYNVTLTVQVANEIRAEWFAMWPEMTAYFAQISACCAAGTYTVLHPISGRQRGRCGYTQACNTYFQSLIADGAKAGLYAVTKACFDPDSVLFNCRPVLFVHDEVIVEIPTDRGPEHVEACAYEIARLLCEAVQVYMPDVEVTASPALMARWYKKAKEARDAAGRLTCWEPYHAPAVVDEPVRSFDDEDTDGDDE